MADLETGMAQLAAAVRRACQPSHVPSLVKGREEVLQFPRAWVIANIETIADHHLDLDDEWEYRRLLELLAQLDTPLRARFVQRGINSAHPGIREAAEDYR
jgi:hypothetical protein